MASTRTAAGFVFSLLALSFASISIPASARPLPAPDLPTPVLADVVPDLAVLSSSRLDVMPGAPAVAADAETSALSPARARHALADFAMKLRNIAYRRGGRDLSTGFDCSGFVHFVFRRALGLDLPSNSTGQFREGSTIARDDLKMGDLVFFRIRGKHVSHVGIYLDNGLFIHAPSTGKRVRIDRLDASYWSKRFVGARRPDALS